MKWPPAERWRRSMVTVQDEHAAVVLLGSVERVFSGGSE
jgi:hypothetical protein